MTWPIKTPSKAKYCYKYPHPAVTTDCVVFGFDGKRLNVLLIIDETAEQFTIPELQRLYESI